MPDWGAHHVDIAQWAIDQCGDGQGPLTIDPIIGDHPIPLKDGMPTKDAKGEDLPKSRVKKLRPQLEKQKKLHEAWKARQSA